MKSKLFFYAIGIIILQGCAMQIGVLNPKPELNIPKTDQTLKLVINDKIENSFLIPEYSGIKTSEVENWHTSLQNGFKNGFNGFFKIDQNNSNPALTLKLLETNLKFVPTSVSGYNNTTVLNVEIEFKAELLNDKNEELNVFEGTAKSEKTINVKGQETEAVENAIENMYQMIAAKFFNR
jgi:hypothetical protein